MYIYKNPTRSSLYSTAWKWEVSHIWWDGKVWSLRFGYPEATATHRPKQSSHARQTHSHSLTSSELRQRHRFLSWWCPSMTLPQEFSFSHWSRLHRELRWQPRLGQPPSALPQGIFGFLAHAKLCKMRCIPEQTIKSILKNAHHSSTNGVMFVHVQ